MQAYRPKIFILDDNIQSLNLLKKLLANKGWELIFESDSTKALNALVNYQPDLFVCDVIMPDVDGFALAEKVRKIDLLEYLPILFLTSKGDLKDICRGFELGAVDYITKPFQKEVLLMRMQTQLDLSLTRKTLANALEITQSELTQTNQALTVLLQRVEQDCILRRKEQVQGLQSIILPIVAQLRTSGLTKAQDGLSRLLEKSLEQAVGPDLGNLKELHQILTNVEMEVAKYIKMGKVTKDIAQLLDKAPRTIEVHRQSIRKKLGLVDQKVSLAAYLNGASN